MHSALTASGVPEKDRFQRVLEFSSDDFRFDPEYPDLTARGTDDFILIEILLSVGRSLKVKKKILADILASLSKARGLSLRLHRLRCRGSLNVQEVTNGN